MIGTMASQITGVSIVYSAVVSDADQRKHRWSALLAFVWGIHRWPVNFPYKGPVTRKIFPLDDVIMCLPLLRILHITGSYFGNHLLQLYFPEILKKSVFILLIAKRLWCSKCVRMKQYTMSTHHLSLISYKHKNKENFVCRITYISWLHYYIC